MYIRRIFPLFLMMMAIAGKAQTTMTLTLENIDIQPGETRKAYIALQNEGYEVIALEFKMELPEGLSLIGRPTLLTERIGSGEDGFGEMVESAKTVNAAKNPAGYWAFSIFSMTDQFPFSGTEGNVIEMTIAAAEDMELGEASIRLYDIELSTKDNPYYPEPSISTVTVNRKYTMTFVLGNGQEDVVKTQDYGSELTAPTDLVRTGYTFAGWQPEVPATVPLGDQTYTAQWNVVTYSITYDLAGGVLAEGVTNPSSYTIESADITLATPTRAGYDFVGWLGTDLAEPTITVTIANGSTGNRSYTAQWTVTTAITTTSLDSQVIGIYDLYGRKMRSTTSVSMLPPGVYIINGRKVVIAK